jgi:hypothetical protein
MMSSSPADATARERLAETRPVAAHGDRRQRDDRGYDGQGVGRRELARRAAEAERVHELHVDRADGVTTAKSAAQLVADVAASAGFEPVDDEALGTAELPGHGVLDEQEPAGQARHVLDADDAGGRLVDADPRRPQAPRGGEAVAGARDEHGRQQRKHEQQHADPHEVALAEGPRDHDPADAEPRDDASSSGELVQRGTHGVDLVRPGRPRGRARGARCRR